MGPVGDFLDYDDYQLATPKGMFFNSPALPGISLKKNQEEASDIS